MHHCWSFDNTGTKIVMRKGLKQFIVVDLKTAKKIFDKKLDFLEGDPEGRILPNNIVMISSNGNWKFFDLEGE